MGIVSVKDVLDQIVNSYVNELLDFELDETLLDEDASEEFLTYCSSDCCLGIEVSL